MYFLLQTQLDKRKENVSSIIYTSHMTKELKLDYVSIMINILQ